MEGLRAHYGEEWVRDHIVVAMGVSDCSAKESEKVAHYAMACGLSGSNIHMETLIANLAQQLGKTYEEVDKDLKEGEGVMLCLHRVADKILQSVGPETISGGYKTEPL